MSEPPHLESSLGLCGSLLVPSKVLGARESRAQGEEAEQVERLGQGHIPYAQK